MPNRIIKESICTSEDINCLSPQAEVLFYRLMVKADDFGCYHGNVKIIKCTCFPLKADDIKDNQMIEWINELIKAGLIFTYTGDDEKQYIKLTKWEKHQQKRAKNSKYPLPKSDDINCNQLHTYVPEKRESRNENRESRIENDILLSEIFDYWNAKKIIVHKELTDEFKKDIQKVLSETTADEIKKSMNHYAEMFHDKGYEFCNYKWGIHEFLTRKEGYKRFLDDGSKWLNYLRHKEEKEAQQNKPGGYTYNYEDGGISL